MAAPDQTVPDELFGCWQRQWIEFADGSRDDTSFVVWLQLPSLMADVRLSAATLALAGDLILVVQDPHWVSSGTDQNGYTNNFAYSSLTLHYLNDLDRLLATVHQSGRRNRLG